MTNWTKHHVIHGENDNCPTLLSASSAPGESGISVLRLRFAGRLQYAATLQRHFVKFQMHPQARLDGTPASQGLSSGAAVGSFAIHPAGMRCTAALDETVDFLAITIDPSRFALAAVESREIGAHVRPHLSGYDEALFDLARMLAVEGDAGYPNGSLYWTTSRKVSLMGC
jgi:AraC family transcriptional regulator